MTAWTYRADQETPSWAADWKDHNGTLLNFATGHTFEAKLVNELTGVVAITKTAGITGAATSPNIVVAWDAGELAIAPAVYRLHLTATSGGLDRMFAPGNEPQIEVLAAT